MSGKPNYKGLIGYRVPSKAEKDNGQKGEFLDVDAHKKFVDRMFPKK